MFAFRVLSTMFWALDCGFGGFRVSALTSYGFGFLVFVCLKKGSIRIIWRVYRDIWECAVVKNLPMSLNQVATMLVTTPNRRRPCTSRYIHPCATRLLLRKLKHMN